VGATNVDTVLLGCYGAAQNKAYCGFVHRNSQGVITQIDSLATSFGVSRVSGIDYELIYDTAKAGLNLPFPGDLRLDLQLGQMFKNTQSNADGSISSYVGTFQVQGSETIAPKWKGLAGIDYRLRAWGAHWDTTYTQSMTSFDDPSNNGYGNVLPNVFYHNLSGSYSFDTTNYFKSASVVLGIKNLLDKEPPFLNGDTTCKCNSIAGPYDFIGRYFYGRVQMKF
jgi:iron complex outermembrane receptor protein